MEPWLQRQGAGVRCENPWLMLLMMMIDDTFVVHWFIPIENDSLNEMREPAIVKDTFALDGVYTFRVRPED